MGCTVSSAIHTTNNNNDIGVIIERRQLRHPYRPNDHHSTETPQPNNIRTQWAVMLDTTEVQYSCL
jgi:hypothetical protein